VGADNAGNAYFTKIEKGLNGDSIEKRFVKYAGDCDPSKLPAAWASWLSKSRAEPPDNVQTERFNPSGMESGQKGAIPSKTVDSVAGRETKSPIMRL